MKKYEKYGLLITVLSLLLIVVYSFEKYDEWDLLIAAMTGYFGVCYIYNRQCIDWFSLFVSSNIVFLSFAIIVVSAHTIFTGTRDLEMWLEQKVFGFSYLFLSCIAIAVLSAWKLPRGTTKFLP